MFLFSLHVMLFCVCFMCRMMLHSQRLQYYTLCVEAKRKIQGSNLVQKISQFHIETQATKFLYQVKEWRMKLGNVTSFGSINRQLDNFQHPPTIVGHSFNIIKKNIIGSSLQRHLCVQVSNVLNCSYAQLRHQYFITFL